MPDVQHKRGTRADLDTLAAADGLLVGQIYVITDEDRLAVALSIGSYQAMAKKGEGGGSSITVDTRENILTTTPQQGALAYATDVQRLFTYDGGWQESSALMMPRSGAVDMGVEQDSNLAGYGADYITDKRLSNVSIGSNADERLGGVRVVFSESLGRNLTQVYLDGAWQTVLTGVNIQTDAAERVPDIEFTDFEPWVLSLITGNSDAKDANGVPVIQNMKIDMGAFSAPLVIDGGSF